MVIVGRGVAEWKAFGRWSFRGGQPPLVLETSGHYSASLSGSALRCKDRRGGIVPRVVGKSDLTGVLFG